MSKDVDRNQVLKTTRVWTTLKKDGSWIQKKEGKKEQDTASEKPAAETQPLPSYFSRVKTYFLSMPDNVDDSADQANAEVIPPQKGKSADSAVDQSKVKNDETEVPADVNGEKIPESDKAQPVSSIKENPGAMSPVEPAEQPVADKAAENLGKSAYSAVDQSKVKHDETEVPADVNGEKIPESDKAQPVSSIKENPGTVSSPEKSDVINTTPGEQSDFQKSMDPVLDLLAKSLFKSPIHSAAETAADESCEKGPPEQTADTAVDQSKVKHDETEVPADVNGEKNAESDKVQPVSSIKEIPGAMSPVEPAEEPVANKAAENQGKSANSTVDQSKVNHDETNVPADVNGEKNAESDKAQPVSLTKENPGANSPVEPAEQPVANKAAENQGKSADSAVDQSKVKHDQTNVPADVNGEKNAKSDKAQPVSYTKGNPGTSSPVEPAEQPVANKAADNKGKSADSAVDQSKVNHDETKVPADVNGEKNAKSDKAQPVSLTKENPGAMSPVEPAEQPVANKAAENQGKSADSAVDQSKVKHDETNVPADVNGEKNPESDKAQPIKENPGAKSPVEPAEQPVANKAAENQGKSADSAVDQSKVKHDETNVPADVNGEKNAESDKVQPVSSIKENPGAMSPVEPAEQPVANKAADNKGKSADSAVDQSKVNHDETKVPADVNGEKNTGSDKAQPVSSTKENPGAMSPVEPAEQPVANKAADNKGKSADSAVDQSKVKHDETNVPADVNGEKNAKSDKAQPVSYTKGNPGTSSPVEPAEQPVANKAADNKGKSADSAVDQSKVNHDETKVPADVNGEKNAKSDKAQPVSSTKENPGAMSPVEPAEEPVVNKAAENQGKSADSAVDQSKVKHDETNVPADVNGEKNAKSDKAQPIKENPGAKSPVEPAEQPVANKAADNKGKSADSAVDQSKVKHDQTNVPADVNGEKNTGSDKAQPVSSTKENPGAMSPVEPAEQPVANKAADNKGTSADSAVDQSKVKQDETNVPADVNGEKNAKSDKAQPVSYTKGNPGTSSPVEPAEQPVANKAADNKAKSADSAVDQSKVNHDETKVPADVNGEKNAKSDKAQPVSLTKENPGANSPVEPAEQPVVNKAADNKGKSADSAVDQSKVKHDETNVPADVNGEKNTGSDKAQQVSSTKENPGAMSPVEPAEQPVANKAADNKGKSADSAVDQSKVKHDQTNVPADVNGEKNAKSDKAQPVSYTKGNPGTSSPVEPAEQPVANKAADNKGKSADSAVDQSKVKHDETNVPADVNGEKNAKSDKAQPVSLTKENPGAMSPVEPAEQPVVNKAADNKGKSADSAVDQSKVNHDETKVPADVNGEKNTGSDKAQPVSSMMENPGAMSPVEPAEQPVVNKAAENQGKSADSALDHSKVNHDETNVPADVNGEKNPESDKAQPVSSIKENPVARDKVVPQNSVEPIPDLVSDTVSESHTQPAAETAVKSVDSKVQPAPSAEPDLQARAGEGVQAADNAVVEPVTASDTKAAQDKSPYRAIELTDALDLEPPTDEDTPEPLKDPKQSTEETKQNQQSDNTNTSEKPVEEPQSPQTLDETRDIKAVCSFCDKIIDGNIRLIISEPQLTCHPECFKCAVCAKALGDLLTPMFLHNQVIQCDGCFAKCPRT